MSTYTVVEAERKKDGKTKDGRDYTVWMLHMEDGEGAVSAEWFSCPPAPAPEPGTKLEGAVEKTNFGVAFKPTRQGGGGFRGGGGKSPQESARIARMAAQKAALELLRIEIDSGLLKPDAVKASELLKPRIDFFFKDAMSAEP